MYLYIQSCVANTLSFCKRRWHERQLNLASGNNNNNEGDIVEVDLRHTGSFQVDNNSESNRHYQRQSDLSGIATYGEDQEGEGKTGKDWQ